MIKILTVTLSVFAAVSAQEAHPTKASSRTPGTPYSPKDVQAIKALRNKVSTKSCDMYKEFDSIFDYCGKTGYVQGYILRYCEDYLAAREDFVNKEWQDGVRTCLQGKLADFALSKSSYPTSKEITDFGFASHQGCYLAPVPEKPEITWCKLPLSDMAKIAWIARGQYWEILKQGIPILIKCFTGGALNLSEFN